MNMQKQSSLHCERCKRKTLCLIRTKSVTRSFKGVRIELEESVACCVRCGEEVYHEECANQTMRHLSEQYRLQKEEME